MSKDGFDNENLLMENLNNKKYSDLNDNLKNFVKYIDQNIKYNDVIYCEKYAGLNKTDLSLKINNISYNISVKKGTGNSIHQENVEDFIEFLNKNYDDLNENISNAIRLFIWGDGTLDGSGKIEDRIDAKTFEKENPDLVEIIKNFFYKHKHDLIKRFLITGLKSKIAPNYIYYGSVENGICISSEYALKWLSDDTNESKSTIPVGRLTFQAWNRNINGGNKSESKRGHIQLKWSHIKKDIIIMSTNYGKNSVKLVNRGTKEGTLEEINFVKELNKKENNKLWKILDLDEKNHYAIHVIYNQLSKLNNRKVKPKADIFIAKGYVSNKDILNRNYYLNENDLKEFKLVPVLNSGISVKLKTSKRYQIIKMSINTFDSIFHNRKLGAGISLFIRNKDELDLNLDILDAWNIDLYNFKKYFSEYVDVSVDKNNMTIEEATLIKQYSIRTITDKINESQKIKEFLFQGIGNFEEPYTVHYLFEKNMLRKDCEIPFNITTGSGRHKGIYTIVLKPK